MRASTLDEALARADDAPQIWIICGAQIYAQSEPLASRTEVTEIAQDFEDDAYASALGAQPVRNRARQPRLDQGPALQFCHAGAVMIATWNRE
jgi:dihydrofolate reductase